MCNRKTNLWYRFPKKLKIAKIGFFARKLDQCCLLAILPKKERKTSIDVLEFEKKSVNTQS